VNKFLHPPMQALKQAARDGDQMKLEAVCEEWSVSAAAERTAPVELDPAGNEKLQAEKAVSETVNAATVETRR